MNHFTIFDAEMYCLLGKINPDNITELYLNHNNLTDISGINIFKNLQVLNLQNNETVINTDPLQNSIKLEILNLGYNKINNLSSLKNLKGLKYLNIENLNLTDELKTVGILKSLPKLNLLTCLNTFKTIDIGNKLKRVDIDD